jgi:molybdopterin-containing oxidoreductase family membrane subunit
MEAFTVFYGSDSAEQTLFVDKVTGALAPVYWATIVCNVALPQLMWFRRLRVNQPLIMLISLLVVVGMWCERYTIVVMSLRRTRLPSAWGNFAGTFWDWATLFGTVGLFATGVLFVVRLMPMIAMFEMRSLLLRRSPQEGAGR